MKMGLEQSNNCFPDIGARVIEEMKNKCLTPKYLSSHLKGKYGRSQASTETLITQIRSGYILETKVGKATPNNLRKLSIFLYAIGIQDDDSLIRDLKEMYGGNFLYPPTDGIPFNKIKPRASNIEIFVEDDYRHLHSDVVHRFLTDEGYKTEHIEYRRTPEPKSLARKILLDQLFVQEYFYTV